MAMVFPFSDPYELEDNPPTVMVSGNGIRVTDTEGKSYIDAASGLWCASLGFSNEPLIRAAEEQLRKLPYYHSFMGRTVQPAIELAEKVISHAPSPLTRAFFGCSGSEAVDSAIKFAWYYNNARGQGDKKRVIARHYAYHGSGVLSASLTGMGYCHDGFDLPGPFVIRTAGPNYATDAEPGESEADFSRRLAAILDEQIREAGPETIAAFIGEPIIGSGGAILPPDGYWAEIQTVLARHDILMIADEIITGFGRAGPWFASELYGIEPDMMTIAKQLSGAYMPISGVLTSEDLYQTIARGAHEKKTFGHGFTYGGHPVAAAVALEAIRQYEAMDLPVHVGSRGHYLGELIKPLADLPQVARVRSQGLIAGIDLVGYPGSPGEHGQAVAAEAEKRGLLYRTVGDTIALSPPLIVEPQELDEIMALLKASIEAVSTEVPS